MKQFFLLFTVALLAAAPVFSQTGSLNDFIDKYKNNDAFTFAFLSKDLFEVATQSEVEQKDWQKLHSVVKNIGSLRILASRQTVHATALYKEALEHIDAASLDELLAVRDGQDQVRIWSKDDGETITDLVLLVGATDDFVLVCFTGQLELGNIAELGRLFDAAEAEQLARTAESVAVDFNISPNPSTGAITLKYAAEQDLPDQLSVIDQNGRLVATRALAESPQQLIQLNELPAGLYWVQLKTQQGKVGVKQLQVVKQP